MRPHPALSWKSDPQLVANIAVAGALLLLDALLLWFALAVIL